MNSITLSIVIVNWNSGEYLANCIDSVIKWTLEIPYEIIVVDNNSSDSSQLFMDQLDVVTLIQLNTNTGFARACNIGFKNTKGKYILFLNPDTEVFANTIDKAVQFLDHQENNHIGICGVRNINENEDTHRHCCHFPSAGTMLSRTVGIDRLLRFTGYYMTSWNHLTTRQVDHVIGSFYLVDRTLVDQLNGFDESFFMYYEDMDFSLRAKISGISCIYYTDSVVMHKCGGSSENVKDRRLFYSLCSRIIYSKKYYCFPQVFIIFISMFVIEFPARLIISLFNLRFGNVMATLTAYMLFIQWLVSTSFVNDS